MRSPSTRRHSIGLHNPRAVRFSRDQLGRNPAGRAQANRADLRARLGPRHVSGAARVRACVDCGTHSPAKEFPVAKFSEIPWIAEHIELYRTDPEKARMWD
ncbi:MAG: hypothetical protein VCC19_04345, partial [Myxococcota bacterium]